MQSDTKMSRPNRTLICSYCYETSHGFGIDSKNFRIDLRLIAINRFLRFDFKIRFSISILILIEFNATRKIILKYNLRRSNFNDRIFMRKFKIKNFKNIYLQKKKKKFAKENKSLKVK